MFFVHAADDKIKADSSAVLYLALRHANVSAELHIFAGGGHGFGLRPTTQPAAGTWPGLCEAWLRSRKFIPPVAAPQNAPSSALHHEDPMERRVARNRQTSHSWIA